MRARIVVGAWGEDSIDTAITNGPTASSDNSAVCSGAAYIYRRTGTDWAQEAFLKASNGQAYDYYGLAVGISGDTVIVGSDYEDSGDVFVTNGISASTDNSKSNSGAVYVYKRTGTTWEQEAYLKGWNSESYDRYGYRVAIDGDTVAVLAIYETGMENINTREGAVYIYRRTGNLWGPEAYLKGTNTEAYDYFGYGLAISGDIVAIGAPYESSSQNTVTIGNSAGSDNSAPESGAVYIFSR